MRTPPLRPHKQLKQKPDILIYNPPGTPMYRMITTFMPRIVGDMVAYPVRKGNKKFLWIDSLIIFQRRVGFGTQFLDFAQNLSRQKNCDGKIRLKAGTNAYDPTTPPHEFYRKYGFGSDKKSALRKIDRAIKTNKHLNYKKTSPLIMYYPDNKKPSLLQKILTKLYL